MSKCELFCKGDTSEFPPSMKSSHVLHLDLLGAPKGDYLFCGKYAASEHSEALKLLSRLVEVGASDPQVALILLRLCGSYCKLFHLARATPPSLVSEALQLFDVEVRQCFTQSIAVEVTDHAWQQAQLNLCVTEVLGFAQFLTTPQLPILPPFVLLALVTHRIHTYLTWLISSTSLSPCLR